MSATQYTLTSIAAVIVGGGEFFGGVVSPAGRDDRRAIMLLTGSLLSFLNVSTDWQLSVQGGHADRRALALRVLLARGAADDGARRMRRAWLERNRWIWSFVGAAVVWLLTSAPFTGAARSRR